MEKAEPRIVYRIEFTRILSKYINRLGTVFVDEASTRCSHYMDDELTRLLQVERAALKFLPKRHLSGCSMNRFSDKAKRHCSCGRDALAAALESK